MKVFRLENRDRLGPYSYGGDYVPTVNDSERHFSVSRWEHDQKRTDALNKYPKNLKFAFTSLNTLNWAFQESLESLAINGVRLVVLDVEVLFHGPQDQVIFEDLRIPEYGINECPHF